MLSSTVLICVFNSTIAIDSSCLPNIYIYNIYIFTYTYTFFLFFIYQYKVSLYRTVYIYFYVSWKMFKMISTCNVAQYKNFDSFLTYFFR